MTNDKALEIARKEKATHRSSLDPEFFYKKEQFETKIGQVKDEKFSGWEYFRTYPPEWSEVI